MPYEKTDRVQLGLKIVNPKNADQHPVSLRIVDTPGNTKLLKRASLYAFEKADIVFILMDASKILDHDTVRDWTNFTLTKIY